MQMSTYPTNIIAITTVHITSAIINIPINIIIAHCTTTPLHRYKAPATFPPPARLYTRPASSTIPIALETATPQLLPHPHYHFPPHDCLRSAHLPPPLRPASLHQPPPPPPHGYIFPTNVPPADVTRWTSPPQTPPCSQTPAARGTVRGGQAAGGCTPTSAFPTVAVPTRRETRR